VTRTTDTLNLFADVPAASLLHHTAHAFRDVIEDSSWNTTLKELGDSLNRATYLPCRASEVAAWAEIGNLVCCCARSYTGLSLWPINPNVGTPLSTLK